MPFSESPRTFRAARDCLISNALFTKIENNARGGPDLIWATTSHLLKKETPLRMLYGLLQPIQLCLPKHHLDTPIWLYRYAQFVVELKKLNPDFFFNKRITNTIFKYLLRSELFGVEGVERSLDEQRTASEIYWTENPARPEESDLKASTYLALLPSQCGSFSTCVQGLVSLNPTNTSLKHFMIGAVGKLLNHLAKERRDILCFEDQMPESLKFYFEGVAAFAKVLEEDEKFHGAVETSKDRLPAVFRPALDLSCLIELDYERRLIIPLACSPFHRKMWLGNEAEKPVLTQNVAEIMNTVDFEYIFRAVNERIAPGSTQWLTYSDLKHYWNIACDQAALAKWEMKEGVKFEVTRKEFDSITNPNDETAEQKSVVGFLGTGSNWVPKKAFLINKKQK